MGLLTSGSSLRRAFPALVGQWRVFAAFVPGYSGVSVVEFHHFPISGAFAWAPGAFTREPLKLSDKFLHPAAGKIKEKDWRKDRAN
jgi:hypothetical protein